MSSVILGIRLSLYDFQRVKLENVDFDSKIEKFKIEVSKKANLPKDSFGKNLAYENLCLFKTVW